MDYTDFKRERKERQADRKKGYEYYELNYVLKKAVAITLS